MHARIEVMPLSMFKFFVKLFESCSVVSKAIVHFVRGHSKSMFPGRGRGFAKKETKASRGRGLMLMQTFPLQR